jgi:S1-C subfamily serine protease
MSDMMPTRPPMYGSPWAAPDPAHRHADVPLHPPGGGGGAGRGPVRRVLSAALVLVLGLVLGLGGAAIIDRGRTTGQSTPATTVPARPTSRATTPPATVSPNTTAPDTVSPNTTTPDTGSPGATTPATTPDTTAGRPVTSSVESLSVGVVDINTVLSYQQEQAAGTGMVLSADGKILTNNHVVDGATSISITVVSTGKSYKATVVGTDPSHDVAVIQAQGASGLTPARFGDSSSVAVGDAVTAVGNAGGDGGEPTVAPGNVTALGQEITASDRDGSNPEQLKNLIQVDANLQPGESGGPLYDDQGNVIGMDTAGGSTRSFRGAAGEGYAIAINDAVAIAKQIEAGNDTDTITLGTPGFLGVSVQNNDGGGALVTEVVSGTPADKIGLQAGDVLTNIDGKTIDTVDAVSAALESHHGGDKVPVTWTDADGKTHTETATLADGPAN